MADYLVVGHDEDDDIDGEDVLGDVLGDYEDDDGFVTSGMDVVGYDGYGMPVVGARRRRKVRRAVARVRKPKWRRQQLAPGVIAPDQTMVPLPMGNVTFDATTQLFTFQGQVQKPFRGERLLVDVVRTGATAVGRLLGQVFVGTDLQQADVNAFDLESVGSPQAFGVRLTMQPVQPGVFIRIATTLSTPVGGVDTIFATVTLLGRYIQ